MPVIFNSRRTMSGVRLIVDCFYNKTGISSISREDLKGEDIPGPHSHRSGVFYTKHCLLPYVRSFLVVYFRRWSCVDKPGDDRNRDDGLQACKPQGKYPANYNSGRGRSSNIASYEKGFSILNLRNKMHTR